MARTMFGADTAQLRAIADRFDGESEAIHAARSSCDVAVDGVDWVGDDADGFRDDWHSLPSPALDALARRMAEWAVALRRQADEQDLASDGTRGAGAGGGAGRGAGGAGGERDPDARGADGGSDPDAREADGGSGPDARGENRGGVPASGGNAEHDGPWAGGQELSGTDRHRARLGEFAGHRDHWNPDDRRWIRERNETFGTQQQLDDARRLNRENGSHARWGRDEHGEWRRFEHPRDIENAHREAEARAEGRDEYDRVEKSRLGVSAEIGGTRDIAREQGWMRSGERELQHGVVASGDVGARLDGGATATIDQEGARLRVNGRVGVGAEGTVAWGQDSSFSGQANGEVFAGARADAHGGITWGQEHGYGARAGVGGFAGVEADVGLAQRLGPFAIEATAGVNAGAGAEAQAGVVFKDGRLAVNLGATAAVGVGANADAGVTIDVGSIYDAARSVPVLERLPERPGWLR